MSEQAAENHEPRDPEELAAARSALVQREWNVPWKGPFLEALSRSRNVSMAARQANVNRQWVYEAQQYDKEFAEAFREAKEIGADLLYGVAWRRATTGEARVTSKTVKVTDDKGKILSVTETTEERVYVSDQVLLALLRAARPDEFRETVNHRHSGGDTPISHVMFRPVSPERALEIACMTKELMEADEIDGEAQEEQDVSDTEEATWTPS